MSSDYHFGIFWSLSCLFFDLCLLITLWYLLVIVLSVLWSKSSGYPFGIFWSLSCLFFDLRLLITLWYLLVIVLSVLWFTSSDYPLVSFGHCIVCSLIYVFWLPFGIFWSLSCLFFDLRLLITTLVFFGHCIVCSLIYVFWLPLWYLLVIVLSVLWFTSADYPFGIFWSLYCLFFDLRLLITTMVSFKFYFFD